MTGQSFGMMSNGDLGTDSSEKQIEDGQESLRAYVSDLILRSASEEGFDAQKIIDANPEIQNHRSLVLDLVYEEYCRRKEAGEDLGQESFVQNFPDYEHSLLQVLQVHHYLETSGTVSEKKQIEWPTPGETFGDYQILQQIGRGSFAQVFLAEQISVDRRRVVLKITRNALDEVRTLAHLKHPRIVEIYTVASDEDGFTAICMPLISQVTLFDLLVDVHANSKVPTSKKDFVTELEKCFQTRTSNTSANRFTSKLPPKMSFVDAVLQVGTDIADALEYSHGEGFLHCDIKPTNILITPDGHSMLFDFNLSAKSDSKTGRIGGTLPYMPPEQLQALIDGDFDFEMTPSADIYSLGVTLYQLLTGKLPFGDISDSSQKSDAAKVMLERHQNTKVSLEHVKGINSSFKKLIVSCLSFKPEHRPPSAASLAKRMRGEATVSKRSRRWVISHPVKALIAAVVLIGIYPACQWLYQYSLRLNQQQFVSLIEEGKAAQKARNFPLAIEIFQKAIERSESYPKRKFLAECFLTMAYAHCGKDDKTSDMLTKLRLAEDKEQRGLVAEILLAAIGSRKKLLDSDTKSVGVTEITLQNLKRLNVDNQNNLLVIQARRVGNKQYSRSDSTDRFAKLLKTSPQHGEANYNYYRYERKLENSDDGDFMHIRPMMIAIAENGRVPEYLTFVLRFYINSYVADPSPEALDKVVEWLSILQESGMPKTVLSGKFNHSLFDPLPSALKVIIDAADDIEPHLDYVYWHGIVDPLSTISIEAFVRD